MTKREAIAAIQGRIATQRTVIAGTDDKKDKALEKAMLRGLLDAKSVIQAIPA